MKLSSQELAQICARACQAARAAGEYIQTKTSDAIQVDYKPGASLAAQVVTNVDREAEAIILDALASTTAAFDFAVLTEERDDDLSRLDKDYFWCIDPIDGTLAFSRGLPGYSVSIALVSKSGVPVIGVVFDPVESSLYSAIQGQGFSVNGSAWQSRLKKQSGNKAKHDTGFLTLPCDHSFVVRSEFETLRNILQTWAGANGFKGIRLLCDGGAVMNALWALDCAPGLYFKLPKEVQGGGSFWDFAATECIYREVGALVTDTFGEQLKFNRPESTFMNKNGVIYCSDPSLSHAIGELICLLQERCLNN